MIAFVEGGLLASRFCTMFVPVKSSRVVVVSFVVAVCGIAYLAAQLTTVSLD